MKQIGYILLLSLLGLCVLPHPRVRAQETENDWVKGVAALKRKDFHEAVDLLSHAGDPEHNIEILMYRGQSLLLSGDYEGALQAFYLADQKAPGSSSFWIARTYVLLGETDKAIQWLEAHLMSSYRRPQQEIVLDTVLSRLEDTPQWRAVWQKEEWYSSKEKGMAEARFLAEQDDYTGALDATKKLITRYGEDPSLLDLRAGINLGSGALSSASDDFQQVLSLRPDDTTALSGLAKVERLQGDYDQAIHALTRLLQLDPVRFDALLQRAEDYADKGAYELGIKDLQQYLSYFPDRPEVIFRMGNYASADGKYLEAMQYFSKVIDQDPSNPLYFTSRADVYMKTHTYRYAVQDYGMALDLDPSNGDVYYRRGEALLKTGKKKEACFDFRQAYHFGKKEAVKYLQEYCGF